MAEHRGVAFALADHLRGCPKCRRHTEELAVSRRVLRDAYDASFDAARLDRIRVTVMERIAGGDHPDVLQSARRLRPATRWLALAASLFVGLALWRLVPLLGPSPSHRVEEARQDRPVETAPVPTAPIRSAPPLEVPTNTWAPHPSQDAARRTAELARTASLPERTAPSPQTATAFLRPGSVLDLTARETEHLQPERVLFAAFENTGEPSAPPLGFAGGAKHPAASPPGRVLLDLTLAPFEEPALRRLVERASYTIYELEDPAEHREENENASS